MLGWGAGGQQIQQWQMVQSGINSTHQLTGTETSISCPKNIPQGCTIEDGQLHHSCLHKQQGRYPLSPSDVLNSGDLDLVSSQGHPHFCTACPWKRKYHSCPRVSYLPRFQRLAARPKGNHTLPYKLRHRSVCQLPNSPTTSIHQLEIRSRSISYRRPNSTLEFSERFCFSPFQPHSSGS